MNITIKTFESGGKTIAINPPLELNVWTKGGGVYGAFYTPFDMEVTNTSMQGLHEDILDWLDMLWTDYACCDEMEMTYGAIALKRILQKRMKEARNE